VVLKTDDPLWTEVLAGTAHDFYHLPQYVELEARRQQGEAMALLVTHVGDDFALLPLITRRLPATLKGIDDKFRDAVSPYGYPCPLFEGVHSEEASWQGEVITQIIAVLAELFICSAFIRLHPLYPAPKLATPSHGTMVRHGNTVWLDLERTEEELRKQMRKTTRNLVGRLYREDFTARMEDSHEALEQFEGIYTETMCRLKVDPAYFFGKQYILDLKKALGSSLHVCLVRHNGQAVAAGLFSEVCGIVQYHLSGTCSDYVHRSPTRLMLDYVRDWSKGRGNKRFHLGGGFGVKDDGLYRFKKGFSADKSEFFSWRIISLPELYEEASQEWARQSLSLDSEADGFFPCYRRPVVSSCR